MQWLTIGMLLRFGLLSLSCKLGSNLKSSMPCMQTLMYLRAGLLIRYTGHCAAQHAEEPLQTL